MRRQLFIKIKPLRFLRRLADPTITCRLCMGWLWLLTLFTDAPEPERADDIKPPFVKAKRKKLYFNQ
ncbi:hypothetical protein Clim_1340 [Chlorobium limicola DSM 245]|uniref:Uncharacterized protein n=1 Tax=Chlorobium limicola (strain DSM 245 / NBRC 103803 / 6330) TaxID=290315 RepID=B3ECX7_CHLL2|nr:hypothetical protein Clim_1340 [Chlorobium limicola DSM 245]